MNNLNEGHVISRTDDQHGRVNIMDKHALAAVGQLVRHKLFDYRGVVVDVDPVFMQTEEWYDTVARSRPPKDEPWYRVLVHDSNQQTYVAERNLELDHSTEPVNHPQLTEFFVDFSDGRYVPSQRHN